MVTLTGRPAMRSPGRPPAQRHVERRFWVKIAEGLSSEKAAIACGVSGPVGVRWFRERGGMPSIQLTPPSGRYLSFAEREDIALLRGQGHGVRAIACTLSRSPSTVSRELRRNSATRCGQVDYRASIAQWKAELQARRPKLAKLASNERLREYVQNRLAGTIARTDGEPVPGPTVRFIGRRHGRRADRRWSTSWSPEQISNRLKRDFPEDATMRISHEAIYQALFIQGRGKRFATPEIMIARRPTEVADRAVPGHWVGDLIIGLNESAIGTLVERTTRFTMLLHLPPMEGHGKQQRVTNGPPLAGHGAEAVRDEIARVTRTLPEQLLRSLTWDQGAELAQHAQLRLDTGLAVYFCDPHSPWQRGTNENTNGLLRQYFPKGTDLHRHCREDLDAVALALNTRPRKTLDWRTPAEDLDKYLLSTQHGIVATTG
ncbi:MAG: IS30 family transposase [Myxococcota bacterium]